MIPTPSRRRLPIGFTLIELLVVIGIIVLLIGILFPVVARAIASGKRARTQGDMGVIQTALEEYKKDHSGQYPAVDGTNTGFAVLARELVGIYGDGISGTGNPPPPDPKDPPAYVAGTTYKPGDCVGPPAGPFYVAMVESVGQTPTTPSPYWAQFTSTNGPRDGVDGPGISVNGRKVGYIPSDRLRVRGCAILDQQDRPILYFRAHGNPNVNKPLNGGPSLIAQAVAGAKFDANDDIQFFARPQDATPVTTLNTNPALKRIQAMLGDFDVAVGTGGTSFDGIIDGSESIAVNGPYLLWAAGPDGFYGINVSEPDLGADAAKIKKGIEKCDDIILATP